MNLITPKRFTLSEYHHLIELGFLSEDDRVELIRGELIQMAAKGTSHSVCNTKLFRELNRLVGDRAVVRGQEPIILPNNSEPEPDIAIASGEADDYLLAHPQPENILLVIEVLDSTLEYDQNTKLSLYSEAAVVNYWIANLVATQLELYSQPYQAPLGNFAYRFKQIVLRHESVKIPGFPDLFLDLERVFPALSSEGVLRG